jgi:hypothetical protein
MTRKHILRIGIGQAIVWIIANVINAYFWPTTGADLGIRIVIPLLIVAVVTALLCYSPSPPQRLPNGNKSVDNKET